MKWFHYVISLCFIEWCRADKRQKACEADAKESQREVENPYCKDTYARLMAKAAAGLIVLRSVARMHVLCSASDGVMRIFMQATLSNDDAFGKHCNPPQITFGSQ